MCCDVIKKIRFLPAVFGTHGYQKVTLGILSNDCAVVNSHLLTLLFIFVTIIIKAVVVF